MNSDEISEIFDVCTEIILINQDIFSEFIISEKYLGLLKSGNINMKVGIFSSIECIRHKVVENILLMFKKVIVNSIDAESLESKLMNILCKDYFETSKTDLKLSGQYFELLENLFVFFFIDRKSVV